MKYRSLLALPVLVASLAACNNASQADAKGDSAASASSRPSIPLSADSASRADDFSFIEGCMMTDTSATNINQSYARCKCIMAQIKLKYGNTDSATVVGLQQDPAELRRILDVCK